MRERTVGLVNDNDRLTSGFSSHLFEGGSSESPSLFKTGEACSRLCEVIIRFEKETIGRGPEEVKAYLVDDLILLREKGIFTRAEKSLIGQEEGDGGRELVREFRRLLLEGRRESLEEKIGEVLGRKVRAMLTDLDIERDERLIILVI